MKSKKMIFVILLLAVFKTVDAMPTLIKPQGQPLYIELTDHLKHPFFLVAGYFAELSGTISRTDQN